MNGVRRFLQGAGSSSTPPPPEVVPLPQTPTSGSGQPTWLPENMQSPTQSSGSSVPPLFAKRKVPPTSSSTNGYSRASSGASPIAGPSSPRRKSVPTAAVASKRVSRELNTRDELLMSLLASEAVVDSREFEILTSEEVEELKKEEQVLNARLTAINKKLTLETKIRDAAISLARVNASRGKAVSKQSEEQLQAANQRLDVAQKELWRLSERANLVHKKLVEHRAGVLSFSVRSMEKKISPPRPPNPDSGYNTPARGSPGPLSPTLSNTTNGSGSTTRVTRFDGAHLFAGHADTIAPRAPRQPQDVSLIEEQLKAATSALGEANKKQGEMSRSLLQLQTEKLAMEQAKGTLEADLPRFERMERELEELLREKEEWERERIAQKGDWDLDRTALADRTREVETLGRRLEALEEQSGEASGMQALMAVATADTQRAVESKNSEINQLRGQWETDRASWETEKTTIDAERAAWERSKEAWQAEKVAMETEWAKERALLEDNSMEDLSRLQDEMDQIRGEETRATQRVQSELDAGLTALRSLTQTHSIPLFSTDASFAGILASMGTHLESLSAKFAAQSAAEQEWAQLRRKLEDDLRAGLDKREALSKEIEEAREQREDARKSTRALEAELKEQASQLSELHIRAASPAIPLDLPEDVGKIVAILQPLWMILPSPETRAAKFANQRPFRAGAASPQSPGTPASPKPGSTSLSELDVRSLKTLYDTKTQLSALPQPFSIEGFAARVQALVTDDKALIERLLRFAQAHDLLKKNAERAQKLASDSNGGLEVYAKQVKTLEERNMLLSGKQAELVDEVQHLQSQIERLTTEKMEVEMHAAEQGETCRQLAEANDTLSARALTLAEEAADAPEMVRRQLDGQLKQLQAQVKAGEAQVKAGETELAACKATLDKAQDELDRMRMADAVKSSSLMDELNSMQELNTTLQNQLRAKK